jgi:hypothetical protein
VANPDLIDITARHHHRPYGTVIANDDIANQQRRLIHVSVGAYGRQSVFKCSNRHFIDQHPRR